MAKKCKYIRQGKEPSCGPVAIYNALVWAGCDSSLKPIKALCGYNGEGVCSGEVDFVLRSIENIKVKKRILNPKLFDIDKALNAGCSVILRYYGYDGHEGHYTLCIKKSKKFYTLVNDRNPYVEGPVLSKKSRKKMADCIRRFKFDVGEVSLPVAWIIGKE